MIVACYKNNFEKNLFIQSFYYYENNDFIKIIT